MQALAKPTVAAWTVNQLARRDAAAVETLLSAGETLRSVQGRLLGGEDASDALRDATGQEREAVRGLTDSAERCWRHRTAGVAGRPRACCGDAAGGGRRGRGTAGARGRTAHHGAGARGLRWARGASVSRSRRPRASGRRTRPTQATNGKRSSSGARSSAGRLRELERAAPGSRARGREGEPHAEKARRRAERAQCRGRCGREGGRRARPASRPFRAGSEPKPGRGSGRPSRPRTASTSSCSENGLRRRGSSAERTN